MQLKLITVSFDPESGGFPHDPLAEIDGEVVNVVEHFFQHEGMPHLLLVVHHRPEDAATQRPARARYTDALRAELSPEQQERYDRLRLWRNGHAQTKGVPPYVLLTNRQTAEIARRHPKSLSELRDIHGMGAGKAGRYGERLPVEHPQGRRPNSTATVRERRVVRVPGGGLRGVVTGPFLSS